MFAGKRFTSWIIDILSYKCLKYCYSILYLDMIQTNHLRVKCRYATYGGFLKWWYPTTMGFPTKNDHFEVFWGYHHLRKHPYSIHIPFMRAPLTFTSFTLAFYCCFWLQAEGGNMNVVTLFSMSQSWFEPNTFPRIMQCDVKYEFSTSCKTQISPRGVHVVQIRSMWIEMTCDFKNQCIVPDSVSLTWCVFFDLLSCAFKSATFTPVAFHFVVLLSLAEHVITGVWILDLVTLRVRDSNHQGIQSVFLCFS